MSRISLGSLMAFISVSLCSCDQAALYSIFPPDDYYDPLLTIAVNPQQETYSSIIVHKYEGLYSVSLTFDRPNATGAGYDLGTLDVRCSIKYQKSRIGLNCGSELLPFWGEKSGVSLGTYEIPQAVPQGEEVEFSLTIESMTQLKEIVNEYGPIELRIEKWSDL